MRRAGFAAVTAAAVLWAVGGTYASRLMEQGASFVELTEARSWITASVLLVAAGRPMARPEAASPGAPRQSPVWLTVVFGLSIAAANLTYYASLARLPVAVAITIQYTAPGLVVLWVALVQGRTPSRRLIASLVGAMVGVALLAELPRVITEGGLRLDTLGLLTAAMSAFAYAAYMISGERVGDALGAQRAVLRGFLVSSALWVVVQALRGRPDTLLDPRFVPGVIFLAVFTTIAPFLLFLWGLRRIRVTDAGITSTLEPLTAAVIAFAWLGERLSPWQVVGGALVLAGIALVQMERPSSQDVLAERAAVE